MQHLQPWHSLTRSLCRKALASSRDCSSTSRRWTNSRLASSSSQPAIFELQNGTVFPFGVPSDDPRRATFVNLNWTIADDDCWAVLCETGTVASHNRNNLLQLLQAQARVQPTRAAAYPILKMLPKINRPLSEGGPREPGIDDVVQSVSFKTRLKKTGDFDDYTARYFHIREEDQLTVRQHLDAALPLHVRQSKGDGIIDALAQQLRIDGLLDLPLVTLCNGQTRRARILRALLRGPELLILEEPFTGLDVDSRPQLASLLAALHSRRSPRMLWVLRPQDELPECVTHIALLGNKPGEVVLGPRQEMVSHPRTQALFEAGARERHRVAQRKQQMRGQRAISAQRQGGNELVALKNVNVAYGPRAVLQNIDWVIREGERWLLSGHNGSGKSTLLSVILGDHPRSFMENVTMFGRPRTNQATATIQAKIGHVSPEIANAFPRKYGPGAMTARDAIVTGFDTVFFRRRPTQEQSVLVDELVAALEIPLLTPKLLDTLFVELSPGEQSLVLLMRALVKKPPLLVLDEPFAGMDKDMVDHVKAFLNDKLDPKQAVVIVNHFEEEVPETVDRILKLEEGKAVERI
ncbi:hypothetical protein ACM66B_000731 [Microbotryomycetes sp. NB124-2]